MHPNDKHNPQILKLTLALNSKYNKHWCWSQRKGRAPTQTHITLHTHRGGIGRQHELWFIQENSVYVWASFFEWFFIQSTSLFEQKAQLLIPPPPPRFFSVILCLPSGRNVTLLMSWKTMVKPCSAVPEEGPMWVWVELTGAFCTVLAFLKKTHKWDYQIKNMNVCHIYKNNDYVQWKAAKQVTGQFMKEICQLETVPPCISVITMRLWKRRDVIQYSIQYVWWCELFNGSLAWGDVTGWGEPGL